MNIIKRNIVYEYRSLQLCISNFLINLFPCDYISNRLFRPMIARLFKVKIGKKCYLRRPIFIDKPSNCKIGDNVMIGKYSYFDASYGINIGNNVRFGYKVTLITSSHEIGEPSLRCGAMIGDPIHIEDGCWIASSVTIGPGVTIGSGSVVGAGSVVLRSVPSNSLTMGNPARPIQKI